MVRSMKMSYIFAFIAAVFWGLGFIGSRFALEELGPAWVTFSRFAIAFVALIPAAKFIKFKEITRELALGAFICSVFLALMIGFQVYGLQYTTVAKSGFITILYAFFTPILCYVFYKKEISKFYWALLGASMLGMFMISDFNISSLNFGDFLTLLCAFASSFHIICVSHFCSKFNSLTINFLQLGFVTIFLLPVAYLFDGVPEAILNGALFENSHSIMGLVFMGIFSTCVAFFLQLKSQEKLPAHTASLIFLLESPIAAGLGFLVFNETLSLLATAGCLVVSCCVALMMFESRLSNIRFVFSLPRRAAYVGLSLMLLFIALFV